MNTKQPLAEVFGFAIQNESERAKRYRSQKLCPYNNIGANCTKDSIDDPIGVCSMFHRDSPVIICPVRFREDWIIVSDAAEFIFEKGVMWTHVGEVRLKDKHGKAAGNIDYVLVSYDDKGRIIDYGSLEVQSVYISGNMKGPFKAYLESPAPDFEWKKGLKVPRPDYLSSSRKRLVPQIIAKGSILKQWSKRQAVALQASFYDTLPQLTEVPKEAADLVFFLYDLVWDEKTISYRLNLVRTVYTDFATTLKEIANFEAGDEKEFRRLLQEKLDAKRNGKEEQIPVEVE